MFATKKNLAGGCAALALAAACSFDPSFEGSKLDCTDKPCPKGWYCPADGEKVCRQGEPPADGGGPADRPDPSDRSDPGSPDGGARDGGGACSNECAEDKLVECTGEHGYHMCSDWDGTGCLVWGPEQYCTGSCENNECSGCTVDCTDKDCGDDGCSGSCGSCTKPPAATCKDNRTLSTYNADGACGDDGKCLYTPTEVECTYGCFNGACADCTPSCAGKECGDDGCGVDCGACDSPPPSVCLDATRLRYYDKAGSCQSFKCAYTSVEIPCQSGCANAQCVNCTPDCAGRQCGSDGCGGACGACGAYAACNASGQCICADADHLNCNGQWSDGCETNRATDRFNCGSCGNTCTLPNTTVTGCSGAQCRVVTCAQDHANCNNNDSDGCEANLKTDAQNCTQCGKACTNPPSNYCLADAKTLREYNAQGTCGGTNCSYAYTDRTCPYGCTAGLCANCMPDCAGKACGDDGCGGACGSCGQNAACGAGQCACQQGFGNCDNNWATGCERPTDADLNNCGGCNKVCSPQHVYTKQCAAGACTYDLCETAWADGDGDRSNGCETWDYFPKAYGGPGYERPYFIGETSDLGFVVAGYSDEWGAGGWDILVLRLDENGGVVWQKAIGGVQVDEGHAAALASDDGVAITGYTASAGAGDTDMAVLKLSAGGAVQFQKVLGGAGEDKPYAIRETYDGGFVVAGKSATGGANGDDMVVAKLDSAGGVQWQKMYGGTGTDWAYAIQQTYDSGYIIAGRTESFGAGGSDFWLIRTDGAGEILWQKTCGGAGDDRAYSVFETIDGGFAAAGVTSSFGAGGRDLALVKFDSNGGILWQKTYGGGAEDLAAAVLETFDDDLLITGYTLSSGAGAADFWVLKTTATGNVIWQRTFGGAGSDMGFASGWTWDDGFAVAGVTTSFGAGNEDLWVLKLNADGTALGACAAGIGAASSLSTGVSLMTVADTAVSAAPASLLAQPASFGVSNASATVQRQCTAP
jgi:hypothetical protein